MLTLKPTSIMTATFHIHKKPFSFPHKNLPNSLPTISTNATTPPPLLAQQGNGENPISVVDGRGGRWWRLTPRARLVLDKGPKKILGFRGGYNKCFSFLGSKRSNFPEKKGEIFGSGSDSSSSSSGSDIVADMGSESKDHNNHNHNGWYQDDLRTKTQSKSPLMHQNEPPRSKLLTLPTILTLGRVAAVPIFVCTFYIDNWWGTTATTSLFIAAAITDWLDGYLARKMRLGSAFGAFLDPVADKLMVAATLILLCSQPLDVFSFGRNPWLLTMPSIAIIGREITMSAVREWAASQDSKLLEAVAVNNLGKWKTATQMIALTILLACRDSSIGGPGIAVATGVILLYISAWLALWSLYVYSRKISKVLLR